MEQKYKQQYQNQLEQSLANIEEDKNKLQERPAKI